MVEVTSDDRREEGADDRRGSTGVLRSSVTMAVLPRLEEDMPANEPAIDAEVAITETLSPDVDVVAGERPSIPGIEDILVDGAEWVVVVIDDCSDRWRESSADDSFNCCSAVSSCRTTNGSI